MVGQDTSLWFWGYLWGDVWNGDFNQCESFGTTTVYGENLDITVTNGIGLPTGKLCDGNSIHGVEEFEMYRLYMNGKLSSSMIVPATE